MIKTLAAGTAAFALLALTVPPASADGRQPSEEATPAASATPAKEKMYCVVSTPTGTRIAHKTCKTRSEWMRDEGFDPLDP